MANKGNGGKYWLLVMLVLMLVLVACGDAPKPTPDYSVALTPVAARPTVKPPYQPAPNITPDPTGTAVAELALIPAPTATLPASPTAAPPTPILMPTPTAPTEGVLTSNELGITGWSDSQISWSPAGDQFVLQVMRGEDQYDYYFLVRPPASPTTSFKLSRTTFGSLDWSPDGRYLSFIDQDAEGNPGPVQIVDTVSGLFQPREIFKGPCTNAAWLNATKLVAACGSVVYRLAADGAASEQPETLYKLDGGRFPGSTMDLSLIARALPSPDGANLALYGLARQKSSLPLGEIAFFNIASGKLNLLDRNNRPVAMVDWTPDSKYLVLRNLTGDWAVPYTFDFYLADPAKQRIVQNITRSNDKCDPVLGAKPDCQGLQPSPFQATRLIFAPDGNRFLFTGIRYVAQPNVALDTLERVVTGAVFGGKAEKPLELASGERVIGPVWLPNGHYFYSRVPLKGPAQAIMDGQPANLKSAALTALTTSGTPQAKTSASPKPSATGTRLASAIQPASPASGAIGSNDEVEDNSAANIEGTPSAFLTPSPSPNGIVAGPVPPERPVNTTPPSGTPTPPPTAGPPTPTQPIVFPSMTSSIGPSGTQIIRVFTATPEPRPTTAPTTRPPASPKPSVTGTATPDTVQLRPVGFYASPKGNWVISLERIASGDKSVQFQVRLIPFSVK